MSINETFLVLGGGGMIGAQVVQQIARQLSPRRVIVASLYQQEVRASVSRFAREFPSVHFVGFWGDVFLRAEWNPHDRRRQMTRARMLDAPERRAALYDDLFGDFEAAYDRSQLAQLVREHKPDVIVDSINTATAISYQDVYTASVVASNQFDALAAQLASANGAGGRAAPAPAPARPGNTL